MEEYVETDSHRHFHLRSWPYTFPVVLIIFIICAIGTWKIFVKARKPGWAALIPIYSNIVQLQIVGKPIWWILLYFIPILNIIIHAIVMCHLGDCFDKSTVFKLGLIFLPVIFEVILGFDGSKYTAPTDTETAYSQ